MQKTVIQLAVLLLAALCSGAGVAQIYKIVHPDGRIEYTDEPTDPETAQPVTLPDLILHPAVPLPDPAASSTLQTDNTAAPRPALSLTSPSDETVVHGNGRQLDFALNATNRPEGSYFRLTQNGAQVLTSNESRFSSPVLFPGTQTFRVDLMSSDDKTLATTAPVRIYVIP